MDGPIICETDTCNSTTPAFVVVVYLKRSISCFSIPCIQDEPHSTGCCCMGFFFRRANGLSSSNLFRIRRHLSWIQRMEDREDSRTVVAKYLAWIGVVRGQRRLCAFGRLLLGLKPSPSILAVNKGLNLGGHLAETAYGFNAGCKAVMEV